jgi:hypothetical protein
MWLVILGMTTVGYGDYTPLTYFGRVIVICACIIGSLILMLITVFVSTSILHSNQENKAYVFTVEIKKRQKLRILSI